MRSALKASSIIFPLSAFKRVYLANRGLWFSLCLSPPRKVGQLRQSFSLFFPFSPLALTLTWLLYSLNSSNCIYLLALCLSSSRFAVGFLHKLLENGIGCRAVTMWCMTMSKLRFQMFRVTLLNLSMNSLRDSPFSLRMLTRAIKVRWCCQLVANCVPNLGTKVSKKSMEFGGSLVNQLKAPSFSKVGNTQHMIALFEVYKLMCVVYTSMCSSGSIVPS